MDQKELGAVAQTHREVDLRHLQREVGKLAILVTMFEQARVRQQEEESRRQTSVEAQHQDGPADWASGIHYTELQPLEPGQPLSEEWNAYCREISRLLAEGQEGRHVLIKGDEVSVFDTSEAAFGEGLKRYLGQSFFIHQIRTEEPCLRVRGFNYPWPIFLSR